MSELYDVIGRKEYDALLADPNGADVISIPVDPGEAPARRGTIVARNEKGIWEPAETGGLDEKQLAVLNEDVPVAEQRDEKKIAPEAAAYRSGRFVAGRVTLKSDAKLEAEADLLALRKQGIVFEAKEGGEGFKNDLGEA